VTLDPEKTYFVRVFIVDGTYADATLTTSWEAFVHQLIAHGCVITSSVWVHRDSINKMVLMEMLPGVAVGDNVVAFPEPQGRA